MINEDTHIEGAVPESIAVLYLLKAAGKLNEAEEKQLAATARYVCGLRSRGTDHEEGGDKVER